MLRQWACRIVKCSGRITHRRLIVIASVASMVACKKTVEGQRKRERERWRDCVWVWAAAVISFWLVGFIFSFILHVRQSQNGISIGYIGVGSTGWGHTRKLLRAACSKECAVHLIGPAPSCRDETCLLVYRFCIAVRSIDVWPRPIGLGSKGAYRHPKHAIGISWLPLYFVAKIIFNIVWESVHVAFTYTNVHYHKLLKGALVQFIPAFNALI